jgi:hypothetical protein
VTIDFLTKTLESIIESQQSTSGNTTNVSTWKS